MLDQGNLWKYGRGGILGRVAECRTEEPGLHGLKAGFEERLENPLSSTYLPLRSPISPNLTLVSFRVPRASIRPRRRKLEISCSEDMLSNLIPRKHWEARLTCPILNWPKPWRWWQVLAVGCGRPYSPASQPKQYTAQHNPASNRRAS